MKKTKYIIISSDLSSDNCFKLGDILISKGCPPENIFSDPGWRENRIKDDIMGLKRKNYVWDKVIIFDLDKNKVITITREEIKKEIYDQNNIQPA